MRHDDQRPDVPVDASAFDAEWEPAPEDAPGMPTPPRAAGPADHLPTVDRPDRPDRPGGGYARPTGPGGRPAPGGPRRFDRSAPAYPPRRPIGAGGEILTLEEGEELVAGRRPVEEAFVARREARRLLVVPQRRMALEKLVLHATNLRIPVLEVEGGSLTAIAGFDGHQGIALVVAPRRWASPDDILAVAAQREQAPLVLVLDSLEDPQNVGTLLRTAEASGVHGAIFPTHRQAPLTPAAIKASAGAVEHLRLAPVDDLAGALADLHARGLRVVGADGDAPLTAREADLRGPIAIVVGSEGRGLGPAVRRRCDLLVRIPMHGRIDSLNAAVAGSILLYEAAAQRGLHGDRPATSSEILGTAGTEDEDAPSLEDASPDEHTGTIPEPESDAVPAHDGTVERRAEVPAAAGAGSVAGAIEPAPVPEPVGAPTPPGEPGEPIEPEPSARNRVRRVTPAERAALTTPPAATPRTPRARRAAPEPAVATPDEAPTDGDPAPVSAASAPVRKPRTRKRPPAAPTATPDPADELLPGEPAVDRPSGAAPDGPGPAS